MKIKRGSTSVRRLIFIADSSSTTGAGLASLVYNSSGLVAYYFAGDLSNEVQITLATATLGTYTSGGFIAVDNTNMPGWYEIGIPDAALDAGNEVAIQLRGATNMVPVNIYIELDAFDYQTATQPVNVTQFGGTNGTFSGGRPEVNTTHWGGTAVAAVTINCNMTQISGDSGAADNAESFFDGTGYAGTNNVIPTVSTVTNGVTVTTNNDKTGYSLASGGLSAISTWTVAITGNITGNLSGSVGSVTGNVGGNVVGSVASVTGRVTANTDQWNGVTVTGMPMPTYTQPTGFLAATFPTDPADQSAVEAAITAATTGLATSANQTTILDRQAYTLAILAGACSDPQTSSETYVLTIGGSTYTVDMAGQTSTGTRTAPTLTKT